MIRTDIHVVAITGGIGAGKSVVSRILMCLGFPVYDCDSRARRIMERDTAIHHRLCREITPAAVDATGCLNRAAISDVVFSDPEKLAALNSIVHGSVRRDLSLWIGSCPGPLAFVETAILYESGLDRMVDEVWEVTAPESVRVDRVCRRSSLTPAQVKARIHSQSAPSAPSSSALPLSRIPNDGTHSVLLRLASLLKIGT